VLFAYTGYGLNCGQQGQEVLRLAHLIMMSLMNSADSGVATGGQVGAMSVIWTFVIMLEITRCITGLITYLDHTQHISD
jgi:hypothetical protein